MNIKAMRLCNALGILLFGLLVPLLPRFYMIYMRSENPERITDVFALLRSPLHYSLTVLPFIFLSVLAWFSMNKNDFNEISVTKRVFWFAVVGVLVALLFYVYLQGDVFAITLYLIYLFAMGIVLSYHRVSDGWLIKRGIGIFTALLLTGYWGLRVSFPAVWGLATYFFFLFSPAVIFVSYYIGGEIGWWIFVRIFPDKKIIGTLWFK